MSTFNRILLLVMLHPRLLSSILFGVWAIEETRAQGYLPLIESSLFDKKDKFPDEEEQTDKLPAIKQSRMISGSPYFVSKYGEAAPPEKAPMNSIAIISMLDVVTKYDQYCGDSGMITKTDLLNRCFQSKNIAGVVVYCDSPGGEASAPERFANAVRNRNKPVIGFVDGLCASAAYRALSPCDELIASSGDDEIGSIGTYITFLDFKEYYEQKGIKIHEIYASRSTAKNIEFREALEGKYDKLRAMIDKINDGFIASVDADRGSKIKGDQCYNGKLHFAESAIAAGLIDSVNTFEHAINRAHELSTSKKTIIF